MLNEFGAAGALIDHVEKLLTPAIPDPRQEFYASIPYPLASFFEGMHAAQRHLARADAWSAGCTFIDVGCGVGFKMALASFLGWRVKGLDLYPEYVAVAKRVLPASPIMVADARDWIDYQADLVYSYRLCTGDADQRDLIGHIVAHMRPGALLFAPGSSQPAGSEQLAPNLWRI